MTPGMGACVIMARMDETQDSVRSWLRSVMDQTELSAHALARKINRAPTTITRALDPASKHTLSHRTIADIVAVTGLPGPGGGRASAPTRMPANEIDGAPLEIETGDSRVDDAVRYLCGDENALAPWRLNTRALEVMGYLPGDVVIVDLNGHPQPGDIVVAQHYKARVETLFRMFTPPFLVAAANDRVPRPPMLVDNATVAIRGVVVAMFRPHRGHLAKMG